MFGKRYYSQVDTEFGLQSWSRLPYWSTLNIDFGVSCPNLVTHSRKGALAMLNALPMVETQI